MAIIEQGILGAFRGKCGNVIGYVRNGVACVRSMPAHYHDRRSAAQLKNRNRMTLVMKVMSAVRPATKLGFGRFAVGMTEMNVATRENYYRLVIEGASGLEYDYSGLVLSRGAVEDLGGVMMASSDGALSLVWDGASCGARGGEEDLVTVVVLNAERMEMRMKRGAARRGDGRVVMALPAGWETEETYCYVMVERSGEWSDSEYVGRIGNGMKALAAGMAGDEAISNFEIKEWEFIVFSDQSAIKVLSKSGQEGGKELPKTDWEADDGGSGERERMT